MLDDRHFVSVSHLRFISVSQLRLNFTNNTPLIKILAILLTHENSPVCVSCLTIIVIINIINVNRSQTKGVI